METSALRRHEAETQFQQAAARCAERSGVGIIPKPAAKAKILGTTKQRFNFDDCMTASGHPVD